MKCVIESPQSMLHVADVMRVRDHPCRVFRADHEVEISEIEVEQALVAVDELPECVLANWYFDQLSLVGAVFVDLPEKSPPQLLRTADREWDWTWRNDRYFHASPAS